MSFSVDTLVASHHLTVGGDLAQVTPPILGYGPLTIRGSGWVEGPMYVGNPYIFPSIWGTTMISPLTNTDSPPALIPGVIPTCLPSNSSPHSLAVIGDLAVFSTVDVALNVNASALVQAGLLMISRGDVWGFCGKERLSNKKDKPFDMPHPTKSGWRLRHVCLEGPEIGVYVHGKGKGGILKMPDYWAGLVKPETITVHLTSIGTSRCLYVEKIVETEIYIGSDKYEDEMEYNYILHASRFDDDLIVEYEGESEQDYPGGNEGFSFSFENDNMERLIKEVIHERLNNMENVNG